MIIVNEVLNGSLFKYWNNKDYYIAQYKMEDDNCICLYNANSFYMYVNSLDDTSIGKYIENLFTSLTHEYVCNIYNALAGTDKSISFMRKIGDSYYEANIFVCDKCLNFIYKKTEKRNLFDFVNKVIDNLEFSYYSKKSNFSVVLDKIDNNYNVNKYSYKAVDYIGESIRNNSNALELFEFKSLCIRNENILDECIKEGNPIRLPEILFTDEGAKYFIITLIPLKEENNLESIIMVYVEISKNEFFSLQNNCFKLNEFKDNNLDYEICNIDIDKLDYNKEYFIENEFNKQFFTILENCNTEKSFLMNNEEIVNKLINHQTVTYNVINKDINSNIKLLFAPKIDKTIVPVLIMKNNIDFKNNEVILEKLTAREKEVTEMIFDGAKNIEIAHKLKISEGTVKKTLYNIYQKLDVTNRVELTRNYYL